MTRNRSVPADIVLPHLAYRDVAQASAWLSNVFGFTEHYRYGDPAAPDGAQVYLGNAFVMLSKARDRLQSPEQSGFSSQSLTIFVDDVEAHYEKAKAAGAKIVEPLHETEYGELQYGVEDLEGHHWLFARHARDVSPEEWGATITNQRSS